MVAIAVGKFIRISPYKVRRIANEIRGKNVVEAESYLKVMTNKGALAIKKVIHSARTNFLIRETEDEENLIVSKILIDGGPMYKRMHSGSRGRANRILKRTCHILVEIDVKK